MNGFTVFYVNILMKHENINFRELRFHILVELILRAHQIQKHVKQSTDVFSTSFLKTENQSIMTKCNAL